MNQETISKRRSPYYLLIDDMLNEALEKMIEEAAELSVAELARRCNITRATVYRHADVFSKLNFYREQQLQAKIRS